MKPFIALALLVLPFAVNAQDLVDTQLTEQVDASVEELARQAVEESVADTIARGVEQTVSDSVENTVTDQVEDNVQDTVEQSVTQAADQQVQEIVQSAVEASVTGNVENAVNSTVSSSVGEAVDALVEGSVAGEVVNRADEPINADSRNPAEVLSEGRSVASVDGKILFYEIMIDGAWRAVHREWLLVLDGDGLSTLRQAGFRILDTERLKHLEMTLVRIRVDAGMDSYEALKKLLPEAIFVDRNHIYDFRPQSGADQPSQPVSHSGAICQDEVRIGLVDTAVNIEHPSLQEASIAQADFRPGPVETDRDHGSAVAGLLVARGNHIEGLVPNAAVSVAAVMYGRNDGSQGATAISLIKAIDWLVDEGVDVINLSLAGPPNRILEKALASVSHRGIAVVAAVGNEGPAAPPLYPAAYDSVIGVTAVDGDRRVYRWANRGEQVDFAAVGVAMQTLNASDGVTVTSGTSLAAPVVSAFAACQLTGGKDTDIIDALAAKAVDLGDPGRDSTFGFGLLAP